MTCSDVVRVLPELLDDAPDGAVQTAFENHVKSCQACSDLVSDLKLIASEARQLEASEEPSPRVWLGIAAQLRAEGLIREPEEAPIGRPILVPSSPVRRWSASSAWWLAPVAASLLAAGSYVISHKPAPQVAKQAPAPALSRAVAPPAAEAPAISALTASALNPAAQPPAQKSAKPTESAGSARVASAAKRAVEPEPSAEDRQFLSVVSTRAPSLRATYESQLQAVNADIREVQAYLARNPEDADARQQLMDAFQKKALLYQIALDRIQ